MSNKVSFTVINTNARSLSPKINSLIDCFSQMEASLGVVTETWLSDGADLEEEIGDLTSGTGLNMVYRNRAVNGRGFSHGGVAIVYREAAMSVRKIRIHNPKDFEVVAAECNLKGIKRKLVVIGCYIPPNYSVPRGRETMEFIGGIVSDVKRRLDDPMVLVAGDYNQWEMEEALVDFPDIQEHGTGNTRGDRRICLLYTSPSPRD